MRWLGPDDVVPVVWPTGVKLLWYSVMGTFESLCLLCLFLYIDLYLLGEYTLISEGSFMQTKHLHVSIRIRKKGEVGTVKHVFFVFVPSIYFY